MKIEIELKKLLIEFIEEVDQNIKNILSPLNLVSFKTASIVGPNQSIKRFERPKNGYDLKTFSFIDPDMLTHYIWVGIMQLSISKRIFDFITANNLSPFRAKKYEDDIRQQPSISKSILAGLITRIYILNAFNISLKTNNTEKAIDELIQFLFQDYFNYSLLVNLHGIIGSINKISLSKDIAIKKATYEIAILFCTYYSINDWTEHEMFEDDYYIEIERKIKKSSYLGCTRDEEKIISIVHKALILSDIGNIETGKILRVSNAWPLITTHQINPITSKINKYKFEFPFKYNLQNDISKRLIENYEIIEKIEFEKTDKKIISSFNRLIKAKASMTIEDRIIELALALEYLINTKQYEVTLQMCLKSIKLYNEKNTDKEIFSRLNDFFILRGDVVHGNKPVSMTTGNIKIINFIEKIINVITLNILLLNINYSLKSINRAVDTSLFVNDSIENILKDK